MRASIPYYRRDAFVSAGVRTRNARQRGVGLLELLTVLAVAGTMLVLATPSLWEGYQRQKVHRVSSETVQVMRYVHLLALKQKVPHRVVFHDLSDTPANTIEVQREEAGSFVTIPGHLYPAPEGVTILNGGSTDSVDSVIVGSRGECQAGQVFIQGHAVLGVVSIESTCRTTRG